MERDVLSAPSGGPGRTSAWTVFRLFLQLGLTSFGGPIAHLGYFRRECVERRRWLDEATYADIVALCQFLPGPASSQVGLLIGLSRAGFAGALAAWLGFTLPSAAALTALACWLSRHGSATTSGWAHGLQLAAVAIVAQAVWRMHRQLAPDGRRALLALAAALVTLYWPVAGGQILAILLGGVIGWRFLPSESPPAPAPLSQAAGPGRRTALAACLLFVALLLLLPVFAARSDSHALALVDRFYHAGAWVYGGGHVVLPLLHNAVVPPGWLSDGTFLVGYGAAQAVPGPLFSFAAFLGAAMRPAPNGLAGAALCLLAIYLPSFLLVTGAWPFWHALRRQQALRAALCGVNAAVVGLLLAALYRPVCTGSIHTTGDFALALCAFALLMFRKLPPLRVVLFCALGGAALAAVPW